MTALAFTGSVTLNKELNFSEPQSLHLSNVNKTHLIDERTEDPPCRAVVKQNLQGIEFGRWPRGRWSQILVITSAGTPFQRHMGGCWGGQPD